MFIKMTKATNGKAVLVNVNEVNGFFDSTVKSNPQIRCTDVEWANSTGCSEVQETIEEIEVMLNKINEVPDVH